MKKANGFTGHGKVCALEFRGCLWTACNWMACETRIAISARVYLQVQKFQMIHHWSKSIGHALVCSKKAIDSWQLPPCSVSIKKVGYCVKTNYQCAIWKICKNDPEIPCPVVNGWCQVNEDGNVKPAVEILHKTAPGLKWYWNYCPYGELCYKQFGLYWFNCVMIDPVTMKKMFWR